MFNSPFAIPQKKFTLVDDRVDIVFISDMFVDDYVGGAELSSEALIESSPFKIKKIHSKDVTIETLESGHKKFWIFGNW